MATYSWARRLHMVRLTRARPFKVSMAFLTMPSSASLRMPTLSQLAGRHAQRQLLLVEVDDEQLERHARDLLLLDADDAADAVSGIDDELVGLEAVALAHGLLFGGQGLAGSSRLLGDRLGRSRCSSRRRLSRSSDLAAGRSFRDRRGNGASRRRGVNRGLCGLGAMRGERLSGLRCFHARLRYNGGLLGWCGRGSGSLRGSGGLHRGSMLRRSGALADNYFLRGWLCGGRLRSRRSRCLGGRDLGGHSGLLHILDGGGFGYRLTCRDGHRACV